MKNILITGSAGQLGSELQKLSQNFGHFNFIFSDITENYTFLDITNPQNVSDFFNRHKIDIIINCAAYTAVDKAEIDKENAFLINVKGAENLTNEAKKINIPIIHISTDYVFDGKNHRPYTEDFPTNPQNIYGQTKLQAEEIVRNYENHIIIRTSWLYSPFGKNFVKTISRLAAEKDQLQVVFDQTGTPTYGGDLAVAIMTIADKYLQNNELHQGIYHFSNEGVCSWYDFALEIIKIKKLDCRIIPVTSDKFPTPAKRPFFSVLDKTKIKKTYQIKIPHWRESLEKCINLSQK